MSQQIPAKHIFMKDQIVSLENLKNMVYDYELRGGNKVETIRFVYHNQVDQDIVIFMDDHDDSVTHFNRVCEVLGL
jgi:hypothetical protein